MCSVIVKIRAVYTALVIIPVYCPLYVIATLVVAKCATRISLLMHKLAVMLRHLVYVSSKPSKEPMKSTQLCSTL